MTVKLNLILKFIVLLIIPFCIVYSQDQEKSRLLLDKVSKNMLSKENMSFEFAYKLENSKEKISQEIVGNAQISGEKYKLNFMDIQQIYDGRKTYTIIPENEEINID